MVEPPRGYRIIIGCQVTRTLSAGFNWPIIVARIEVGAASVQIGVKLLGWPALCAQAQRQRSADFPTRSFAIVATTSSAGYCHLCHPRRERKIPLVPCVSCIYVCIYIYLRCTRTGLDSIRARACMRACERAWTRERDRDRNREQERAQIGHGWSVRSSFQTTPSSPLPSSPLLRHLPPFVLSLFRPSPLTPYLRLSPPDRMSRRPVLVSRARPPRIDLSCSSNSATPMLPSRSPLLHSHPPSSLLDSACTVSELLGTLA